MKIKDCNGSIINNRNADGIALMNGPKNGIMLHIATRILISKAYSKLNIDITTKHKTPIIVESKILPTINRPHLLSVTSTTS